MCACARIKGNGRVTVGRFVGVLHRLESGGRGMPGRERDAWQGTTFPTRSRKVWERCSCIGFAPPGRVCQSACPEYCKSPSPAGLSHLGCAHEGLTRPSGLCLHMLSLPSVVPCRAWWGFIPHLGIVLLPGANPLPAS